MASLGPQVSKNTILKGDQIWLRSKKFLVPWAQQYGDEVTWLVLTPPFVSQ